MKTILPAGEPNYRAAHAAYRRVTAYWAPEWIDSPEHFAKLLDAMLAAAGETCDPAEASDSPTCPKCGAPMLPSFSLRTFWCDGCGHVNDPERTREAVERREQTKLAAAPPAERESAR